VLPSPRQRAERLAAAVLGSATAAGDVKGPHAIAPDTLDKMRRRFGAPIEAARPALPSDIGVSIVVPTFDRPDHLERCLRSLSVQELRRPLEIVVVDNHPDSGATAPIVARFPHVRLVGERRKGLSYARNAGIRAARGAIIVTTDDDVVAPPEWVESIVAPFVDPNVMVVTGNVLAADLSHESQRLFEAYGGLGRGTTPQRVDHDWFWAFRQAVPTWRLGATANAAFRAAIFRHPAIGLLDEALGAGTPTGCSEDTYLFYKVLRAGYAIQYEPAAMVWHHHRTDVRSLTRQIYAYAKGHIAYQLTTLVRDRDARALVRIFGSLPALYASRAVARWRRRSHYPLWLIGVEVAGNLAGPFALWRSRARVRRLGRSEACEDVVPNESRILQERAS
jgi:glycosyltransferase involved in cell wall biosynthesis